MNILKTPTLPNERVNMNAVELAFSVDANKDESGRCPTSEKTCKKEISPESLFCRDDFQAILESLTLND